MLLKFAFKDMHFYEMVYPLAYSKHYNCFQDVWEQILLYLNNKNITEPTNQIQPGRCVQ